MMSMILAAIDLDALVPLLVGVFWVIAQIAGAAAKKKAPKKSAFETRSNDRSTGSEKDPFADLMRQLGGTQEFKIPTPPEPQELENAKPWKPGDIEALPDIEPIQRKEPLPELKPVSVPVEAADVRPRMSSFKSAMPSMKFPSMKLNFRPSDPRYSESAFGESERPKTGGKVPDIGKIIDPADRKALRKAVLAHVILSKPKALEGWSTGTVEP
jgi:hypothetical protein